MLREMNLGLRCPKVLFPLLLITLCGLWSAAQQHATLTVNVLSDDGVSENECLTSGTCSLRNAWEACKNVSSLAAGCTILLPTESEIVTNSTNGPLLLEPFNNIKIVANHSTSIRSDGLASDMFHARLVYFLSTAIGTQATLSLEGLTISGFGLSDGSGGAVYSNGNARLSIKNCTFVNNRANSGGSMMIRNNLAGVVITDSHFLTGQATNGGALAFDDNTAGALIENSTFYGCQATEFGGAIFIGDNVASFTLRGSDVVECTATIGGGGLGILINNYNISVEHSRFLHNSAANGGSIITVFFNRDIRIVDTQIGHSYAEESGGGLLFLMDAEEISMEGLWAHDCHANLGGAVCFQENNLGARITRSRFENCRAETAGGAVFASKANHHLRIADSTFKGCHTYGNGAVLMLDEGNDNVALDGITAENCYAAGGGGAVCLLLHNNYYLIKNSVFKNCTTMQDGGALLTGSGNLHMLVERTNFTGCVGGEGGAISLLVDTNNFTLTHSRIEDCVGKLGGALAIMNEHDQMNIYRTSFINNHAVDGGAIHSNAETHLLIVSGSNFVGNKAVRDGGAIFLNGANEKFLITDTETARRTVIGETAHPYECFNPPMVVLDHFDPGASAFQVQIDSKSAIGALDDFDILDGNGNTLYYGAFDRKWPGVQMPPLVVRGSRIRVRLTCNNETDPVTLSRNLYGMRVVATPVLEEIGDITAFALNKAGGSGGAISAPYGAAFGRVAHVQFSHNTAAENGGAISLGSATKGVTVVSAEFQENEAGISGGAVSLGSACDSTDFYFCNFDMNSAGDSGGALAMIFGNGATAILLSGTLTRLLECTFTHNSADFGGAVYLDRKNAVILEHSVLLHNEALDSGGAIYAATDNDISLNNTLVAHGTAGSAGGGLATQARNSFVLVDVVIQNNTAGEFGGGVYTSGGTTVIVDQHVRVENNSAAVAGGGLASFECPLWDRDAGSTLVIAGNRAQRGSALYLKALVKTDASDEAGLRDMVIADNVATVGGTVYWLFDSDMTSEPEGVNSTSVVWEGNVALYGERVATQAIQVQGPAEYTVEVFGQALDPPLEFVLQDLYGQEMPIQGPTLMGARLEGTSASNCSGRIPFLSGGQQEVVNRTAEFSHLQANCAPEGEIAVRFTAALLDLTEIVGTGQLEEYAVARTVTMTYRSCRRGEFIQDGQCVTCPTGTYSLEYPVTQDTACVDCTGKSGVVTCYGDVIEVSGGYWRRHNTSEAVLDCLGDVNGCMGGVGTGDALCEEGYEGPLCAVCADGYYSSSGVCELCSGDTKLNTTTIVFLGIAGLVIMVAIFAFYAKCLDGEEVEEDSSTKPEQNGLQRYTTKSWIQQQFQDMRAQLKIVITTYQIVSEVPGNLNVEFPSKFTSFLRAFSVFNLNVISVVPFSCTRHYTFIDKLVATTLFPIGLSLLLALLCAADVARLTYLRENYDRDVIAKISAAKDQYLTYFFFLTYLVLPSVSTTIFQTFLCTNVDPDREDNDKYDTYLIADMSISCTSSYYYRGVAYAVAMLLVYVVGIPLMYFLLLYYNREAIAGRDDVPPPSDTAGRINEAEDTDHPAVDAAQRELPASVKRLSFLWDAYEPQFWYWEVVETTRRLMLTAVLSVCGAGTSAQSIFAVLLGLLYIKLYGFFAPYEDDGDDVVAEVGQFQIFFSFLGALIYQNSLLGSQWNDAVSAVLIFINATVTVLFFYYGVRSVQEQWEERKEYFRLRAEKQDENGEVELCVRDDDGGDYDDSRQQEPVRTERIAAAVGPTAAQQYARHQDRDEVMEAALRVQRTSEHVGEDNTDALDGADVICNADVIRDYF